MWHDLFICAKWSMNMWITHSYVTVWHCLVHSVGRTLRLITRPRDQVQHGETPSYKSWAIFLFSKPLPGFTKLPNLGGQYGELMARRHHRWAHRLLLRNPRAVQAARSWYTIGQANQLDFLWLSRSGLPCQEQGSRACKSKCLQCFHRRNLVRGDDLKVRPTQYI